MIKTFSKNIQKFRQKQVLKNEKKLSQQFLNQQNCELTCFITFYGLKFLILNSKTINRKG